MASVIASPLWRRLILVHVHGANCRVYDHLDLLCFVSKRFVILGFAMRSQVTYVFSASPSLPPLI
jgi:hypothetical protein